jgi:hypothetical protein
MNTVGSLLATTMLSIHTAEMEQAARCPGWLSSARSERHIVLYQRGNRTICRLGCLIERAGQRLQQYGMPRPLSLGSNATQSR